MRILYLMHVDWRWIKQRPHFLAEQLAGKHEVCIFYRPHPGRFRLPKNPSALEALPFLPLPTSVPRLFRRLTRALQQRWLATMTRAARPDLVWVTFPTLVDYIPPQYRDAPLVYDCMDDVTGFTTDSQKAARLRKLEDQLCERASHIFCSSEALMKDLSGRCRKGTDLVVVRNAVSALLAERTPPSRRQPTDHATAHLGYIGTIAEWFDIELVRRAVATFPGLHVHLVGPVAGVPASALRHERIILHGTIAHERIADIATKFDALIMPFRVTSLIERVDPVKLYEYLTFDRPVISVYYDEIARFAPYVHFYKNADEFISLAKLSVDHTLLPRESPREVAGFIRQNTWAARQTIIDETLARSTVRHSS